MIPMPPAKLLSTGKIPKDILKRIVFKYLGAPSERVIKGPQIGEDAALIDMGEKILVAKANPITGAESKIGWLSVHINANDVAARGAKPLWFLSTILLPEGSDETLLDTIMSEQHQACTELGISIVGGHTEVAPGLNRPIVAGFMLGEVSKKNFITTSGAEPGDEILLTKGAGLEGTGILAADLRHHLIDSISEETLDRASLLLENISVVPEALKAIETGGVHSIHTPTEGGILNGLLEISEASGLGFTIYEKKILIAPETREICESLGVDPLKLLSSGSLLIVVDPVKSNEIINNLKGIGVEADVIGQVTESQDKIYIKKNGEPESVGSVDQDELFRVLEKYS